MSPPQPKPPDGPARDPSGGLSLSESYFSTTLADIPVYRFQMFLRAG